MHEPASRTLVGDPPDRRELEAAARLLGIENEYWDVWGRRHAASPEAQTAILTSLGVNGATQESLGQALEERELRQWRKPLPPTIVCTEHRPPHEAMLSLPADRADSPAVLEIRFEDGNSLRLPVDLGALPVSASKQVDGRPLVRKSLKLPDALPLGYHELTLELAGERWPAARLIVCPSRAYHPEWLEAGRTAGLAISLFGLRSERNWGCGDITDLKAVIDWAAEHAGADFIALNPLHAIPNRQPFNISPYLPNSIFFRNPLYLDLEATEDFRASAKARALRQSPAVENEIQALRASEFVEYEGVYRLKIRFLKLLFHSFLDERRRNSPRADEFRQYIERQGDLLHRFAVHAALDESMHAHCPEVWTWRAWPDQYQDPESPAVAEFARKHWRSVLFHKYLQWQLDLQLASAQQHARERGRRIGLYHDLALATDRFGADLWAHRDFFVSGCRVGAPPDDFSPKGQDWAFPPPNSERHYQDGYRLFAESIRKNMRHGGALRIDHVMRFFRLYWIPDGSEATDGTYVRDRAEDLLSILALESVRQQIPIVGEDLGTVPDEIRESLHRFGILSYRLLYFERGPNGRFRTPAEYPREALVSVTTHDLPTLAGFWLGRDIEARRAAGLLPEESSYRKMTEERAGEKQRILDVLHELHLLPDWFPRSAREVPELTGELHNAIVGFLASTPSKLMVLNQEDLLKETEQQNLPGTTEQYPNWRRKMRCTVEELWTSPEIQAFTQMFRDWMARTGRMNAA
ncbi:MAG TPA: 4-alpha-glucanotransferase [Bryobacteraceae bacterium]|nr:4-alpha-glucanotransferase [Bryobacteraceae bacterium]